MTLTIPHRPYQSWDRQASDAQDVVRIAGEVAHESSKNADLRRVAGQICARLTRVDLTGAREIGAWVRKYVQYMQETPGVEVLQGPYTTLRSRVGDCDDLVILWAALCQSIGLDAQFAGVRVIGESEFMHAIGYLPMSRQFVELTDDRKYGGKRGALMQKALPAGCEAVYWHPLEERYIIAASGGPSVSTMAGSLVDRPGFPLFAVMAVSALLLWRHHG